MEYFIDVMYYLVVFKIVLLLLLMTVSEYPRKSTTNSLGTDVARTIINLLFFAWLIYLKHFL